MQACAEALRRSSDAAEPMPVLTAADPAERLAAQWSDAVARARLEIDEAAQQGCGVSAERLAGGLIAALGRLLGGRAEPAGRGGGIQVRVTVGKSTPVYVVIAQQTNHRSLATTIRHATDLPAGKRHLLLRERALSIPPTWKEVERCLGVFKATGDASFVEVDREDVARLLALEAFVTAAHSCDLSADDGSPIPASDVLSWAARSLGCTAWGPIEAVLSTGAPAPCVDTTPAPARVVAPATPPVSEPRSPAAPGAGLAVLRRLRVASVERVVHEVQAGSSSPSRADVVAELRRQPVRWFGESIVALPRGAP